MRRAHLLLLAAITLAGGGLRAAQAVDPPPGLNADERAYVRAAVRLVDERRYVQTHYPPGTPGLFAVAYALGGRDGLELPAGYWAQALVGTALILATYALAALMAGPWAGLAAAAVVAFHRPFIFRTEKLLSEPLAALLLTAGLAAMAWALSQERPSIRRLALAGALLGALAVTRANLALVAVVLAGVLLVAHGPRAAAALLLPALVVIAPWSAYASHWEGRFVPLATGSGASLFVGTYLPGGGSTYGAKLALADEVRRRHPRLRGVPAPRLPGPRVFETVAARHPGLHADAALAREARRNVARAVRDEPAAFARLLLSKPVKLWWGYSEGPRRADPAAAVAAHRVLLVISVLLLGAGVLLTRRPMLIACALVLVAVTAQHALLLALPRYGFPLLPVLYAAAAAAGAGLIGLRGRARAAGRASP